LRILGEYIQNKRKKQKITLPTLPHSQKEKTGQHECMLSLPIGCMEFLFPKTVGHHFCPGLIPGQKFGDIVNLSVKSGKVGTRTLPVW
jgi:hypothetical protein